jgi:membrane-bound serine protease (ClpP class)
MEGVTKIRKRNLDFSKRMITEGISLSSEEAVKQGVVDILAISEMDFLQKSHMREVLVGPELQKHFVNVGTVQEYDRDLRAKILDFIADPEFAYLIFMGSLALLYAEITHPGLLLPGIVGGVGLVLSLVAFHKLNVEWGGLGLILLGIGLLVAELFVASFGVLGIGGLVALFVGSVLLFDVAVTGYTLPYTLIASVVGVIAIIFGGLGLIAVRTLGMKTKGHDDDLKELPNRIVFLEANGMSGKLEVGGEVWSFVSEEPLLLEDKVIVLDRELLILKVKKHRE